LSFLEDLIHVLQAEEILNADNNIFAGDWNIVLNNHMDKQDGIDNPKNNQDKKMRKSHNYIIWLMCGG